MAKYIRTSILNFSDLPIGAQSEILKDREQSEASETSWIKDPCDENSFLPLDMFVYAEGSKLWSGIYAQSYFSAYFIKLDRSGQIAIIGYRYC